MSSETQAADPVGAFTTDQASELTNLSSSTLRYWDKTEFYSPEAGRHRAGPYSLLYSFRDIVALRTIGLLREHASLQSLRRAVDLLRKHDYHPWANLEFFRREGDPTIFFVVEKKPIVVANANSQITFNIELAKVSDNMLDLVRQMRERKSEEIGQTSQHRYVAHNQRVVAGTRIPTSAIWEFHQAGYSTNEIIEEYPRLEPPDIREAIRLHEDEAAALIK